MFLECVVKSCYSSVAGHLCLLSFHYSCYKFVNFIDFPKNQISIDFCSYLYCSLPSVYFAVFLVFIRREFRLLIWDLSSPHPPTEPSLSHRLFRNGFFFSPRCLVSKFFFLSFCYCFLFWFNYGYRPCSIWFQFSI